MKLANSKVLFTLETANVSDGTYFQLRLNGGIKIQSFA